MKNIAVIGTGVIGTGWILRFIANGIRVKAFDKNSQQLHFLKEEIMSSIKKFFFGSKINFHSLHYWKYAKVANKCLGCQIDPKYPVAIAGDFLEGSNVEAAFISGEKAADLIFDRFQTM